MTKPMLTVETWIISWVGLLCNILRIISFCKIDPSWEVDLMQFYIIKNIQKRKLQREQDKTK
jgi:hypothetical protein